LENDCKSKLGLWHDAGMDDEILTTTVPAKSSLTAPLKSWVADLNLQFESKEGRSFLAKRIILAR